MAISAIPISIDLLGISNDIINLDSITTVNNFNVSFEYIRFSPTENSIESKSPFDFDPPNNSKITLKNVLSWESHPITENIDILGLEQTGFLNQNDKDTLNSKKQTFIDEVIKISKIILKESRFIFFNQQLGFNQAEKLTGSIKFISSTTAAPATSEQFFTPTIFNTAAEGVDLQNSKFFINTAENFKLTTSERGNYTVCGFLIFKEESNENNFDDENFINLKDRFIITNGNIRNFTDYKLKYGKYYRYTIYPIIKLFIQDSPATFIRIFILSNNFKQTIINTIEHIPPEYPIDFSHDYNEINNELLLSWTSTNNKTRDIKYFEIFRRESINDPYQLLELQDFDNNISRSFNHILPEIFINRQYEVIRNPDTSISRIDSFPTFNYIDRDFNKNKKFIYAIRSIDARGLKSNYSAQIEVSFDFKNNKINKKLISRAGAPEQYPNLFIEIIDQLPRTFNVLSKYKSFDLYFDPDNFSINNSVNRIDLINYFDNSNDGRTGTSRPLEKEIFKLNFINIDSKKQNSIKININKKIE